MAINVITNLKIFLLILALCALLFLSNTQATTELYNKCEKEFWYKNQKDFKKSIKSECLKEKRHHEKRHRQYHSCNDKSYDKNVVVSRWEKFSDCRCKAALTEMGDSKGVFVCYQIAQFNKASGEFTAELSIHKKKSKDSYDVTVEFSHDVKVMNDDGEYDGVTYRTEKVPSDETNEKYYISGKIPKTESMNKVSIDRISPTDLKLTVNDEEPKDLKKNSGYAIVPYSKFVPGENFLTSNNGPSNNNDNNDPTNTPSTNDPTGPTDSGPTNPGPSNPADPTGGPTENSPTNPSNPAADPNSPTNPTGPTDAGPTNPGPTDPSNPADPTDPTDPTANGPNDGPTGGPTDPSNPADPTDPTDPTGGPTDGPTNPTTDGATGPTDSSNPAGPADPTDPTDPTSDSTDTDPNDSTNSDSTDPTDPTDPTPAAASIQTPEAKQEEANNGNQPSSGGVSPGAVGSIVFGVIIAIGGVFIGWNTYERLRWRRQYRRRQAAAAQQNTSLANVPDYNGYGRAY